MNVLMSTTGKPTYKRVNQESILNYADGRLITQSAAADSPGPEDPSQTVCDVAGWTMYFGIFHGGTCCKNLRKNLSAMQI